MVLVSVVVVVVVAREEVGGFDEAVEDARSFSHVSSSSSSSSTTQALFAAQVGAVGARVREALLAIGALVRLFTWRGGAGGGTNRVMSHTFTWLQFSVMLALFAVQRMQDIASYRCECGGVL